MNTKFIANHSQLLNVNICNEFELVDASLIVRWAVISK